MNNFHKVCKTGVKKNRGRFWVLPSFFEEVIPGSATWSWGGSNLTLWHTLLDLPSPTEPLRLLLLFVSKLVDSVVSILGALTVESFRALLSLGNSADPFSKPETVFIGLYSGNWVSTFKLRWFNEFLRSAAKSVGVNVTVGIRTIAEVLRNFTSSFVQVRVF